MLSYTKNNDFYKVYLNGECIATLRWLESVQTFFTVIKQVEGIK